jgi:diamine N-acetyltransferase
MIDAAHQRKGYGRAALVEVIRRLRLEPEVEMIVTSHRHDNAVVANLCDDRTGLESWIRPRGESHGRSR